MKKREKVDIYFKMNSHYYLLFSVVQMADNGKVDLKITDFYNVFIIEKDGNTREDGVMTELEMESSTFISKAEMSYHADGSFLRKNKDYNDIKYYNPYGKGVRWTPIDSIVDFQPIMHICIRRMEIYNKRISNIPIDTDKRKSHICECDELFDLEGTYLIVLFIRHKSFPFCRCGSRHNYCNIVTELNSQLDLCIFIQRHSYPKPQPYYSKYFKCWITPYAHNSINFCNKEYSKEEMMDKLGNTMFNPNFYRFLNILNSGEYFYFSENKLKVIDAIDTYFDGFENKWKLSKPLFIKFILQLLGEDIDTFNALSPTTKTNFLSLIYSTITNEIQTM